MFWHSRPNGSRRFGTIGLLGVVVSREDFMGVDLLGVDVMILIHTRESDQMSHIVPSNGFRSLVQLPDISGENSLSLVKVGRKTLRNRSN